MRDFILVGPKHCGKTSAGRDLAQRLGCGFFDLDELILQRTGKTSRQLYSEDPAVFQKAETASLSALLAAADKSGGSCRVIATGGGIIDNSEAVELIKNSGANIVYLNVSSATAWQRIAESGELPPFLQTENPQETHRILHERRAAAYLQIANIIINGD